MAYKNPPTAVDLIIEVYNEGKMDGIVLIERGHPPFKGQKAFPGGFQEWNETLEETAIREGKEETGLDIELIAQLRVNSGPKRDPRGPVNAVGYVARANGKPVGGDDAADAKIYALENIPKPLAFDHEQRLMEYLEWKKR